MHRRLSLPFRLKPLFITAVVLLSFIISATASIFPSSTASAQAATYATETDLQTLLKAIKYYNDLAYCAQSGNAFKTLISGDDISNGPHVWVNSGSTVSIGKQLDQWGTKDGITGCDGESDSEPGWISDSLSFFGVNLRDNNKGYRDQSLGELGYTCKQIGSQKTCSNANANADENTKGSILYILRHLPYLNGTNLRNLSPTNQTLMAVSYNAAYSDYSGLCGASKGGTSNLANISIINPDGTITQQQWGGGKSSIDWGAGELALTASGADPLSVYAGSAVVEAGCTSIAKYLDAAHAKAYLAYVNEQACKKQYTDGSQLAACIDGTKNKTNINYCTTTYSDAKNAYQGSTLVMNQPLRLACYVGQGNQGEEDCVVALKYTDTTGLQACIKGAQNATDATYCATNYGDSYQGSSLVSNQANRQACLDGQKHPAAGGLIPIASTCPTGSTDPTCNTTNNKASTCVIPGIGWLLCPVVNFMADANDGLYAILSGLLVVDTNSLSTDCTSVNGCPTYAAWGAIRNVANVGLIIVFLVIIFSQISSFGISNYGVKKMLPRLVIAAVLINVSFLICQVAVDVFNIIGGSILPFFDNMTVFGQPAGVLSTSSVAGGILAGTVAIGAVAAGVTAAIIAGSLLVPVLVAALLAVFVTVLILATRKVVIVLLVVLAPIAFLAMLLPGTEGLYKQWRKILIAMLIVYPEIGLLFAGSTLASKIITASGTDALQQIIGIIVTFVPLLVTPFLLQSSLKAVPMLGNFASKLASRANSNVGKSASKRLKPLVDSALSNREAGLTWRGKERYKKSRNNGFETERKADGSLVPKLDANDMPIPKKGGAVLKKDAEGHYSIAEPNRRTFSQTLGQRGKLTEKNIATNKALADTNYDKNALTGQNVTGRAANIIADRSKSVAGAQEAVNKIYDARLKSRQTQHGTSESSELKLLHGAEDTNKYFDQRIADEHTESIKSNAENTAARAIGIQGEGVELVIGHDNEGKALTYNQGEVDAAGVVHAAGDPRTETVTRQLDRLGGLNNATFAVEAGAKAGEKEIEQYNEESGVSAGATHRMQSATKNVEAIHGEEEKELQERLAPTGDLAGVQSRIDTSATETQAAKGRQTAAVEARKASGDLVNVQADIDTSATLTDEQKAIQAATLAERKKFGGDLFTSAVGTAKSKKTAAAADKLVESQVNEISGKDTTKRKLADRLLGTRPERSQYQSEQEYLDAATAWDTKAEQLTEVEDGGLRKGLQAAAREDYTASSRLTQANADLTLGIDAEMLAKTKTPKEKAEQEAMIKNATGVGNRKRVIASAARRLQEDRRTDVTATEDLYQRVSLGRDDNMLLQGNDVESGEELFDDNGKFIFKGRDKAHRDEVWANYVRAREKVGEPLPTDLASAKPSTSDIVIPEDSLMDEVQEEALVRRTVKEGDQKVNEQLPGRLAERYERAQELYDSIDESAEPDRKEKAGEARDIASKLLTAMTEQYASNPAALSPFASSGDRGAAAKGTLTRHADEQVINTFASEKVGSPGFPAKWNIEHYKAARKVWIELAKPPREVSDKVRGKVNAKLSPEMVARGEANSNDPEYVSAFRKVRIEDMIDTNLEKDGVKKTDANYTDEYAKRYASLGDSIKGLDDVDSDPAYSGVLDRRAHVEIASMRNSMDILRASGAIPEPKADAGVSYRRPSYTKQAGVVETVPGTTQPVYLKQVANRETDPDNPTKTRPKDPSNPNEFLDEKYTIDAEGRDITYTSYTATPVADANTPISQLPDVPPDLAPPSQGYSNTGPSGSNPFEVPPTPPNNP